MYIGADVPAHDTTKGESIEIPFKDQIPVGKVLLEVKFNQFRDHGHCLDPIMKKFTQHCNINNSYCGLLVNNESTTANFHVPTKSVSAIEQKITNSECALANMNVSYVKISGKTVYDCVTDSARPNSNKVQTL